MQPVGSKVRGFQGNNIEKSMFLCKAASKYSELEHWGRLPLEDLEVQIACPGFQILDFNILVP